MFAIHRLSLYLAAEYYIQHVSAANQFFLLGTSVPAYSETYHASAAAYERRGDSLPEEFTEAPPLLLTKFSKKFQNIWWK